LAAWILKISSKFDKFENNLIYAELEKVLRYFSKNAHLSDRVPHIFAAKGGFWFTQQKLGPQGILDGFLGFFETIFWLWV
jgi:predicted Mrr-cat superfamily restriction endonuclease